MPILFEGLFFLEHIKHEGGFGGSRTTIDAKQALSMIEQGAPFPASLRLVAPIDLGMDRAMGQALKVTIEIVSLPDQETDQCRPQANRS